MGDIRYPYENELLNMMSSRIPGMMTQDQRVTFNPFTGLSSGQMDSVMQNEQARLMMQRTQPPFSGGPTQQQQSLFQGSPYEGNQKEMLRTILSRLLSRDPSAGQPTQQQSGQVDYLRRQMTPQ